MSRRAGWDRIEVCYGHVVLWDSSGDILFGSLACCTVEEWLAGIFEW